jgi:hypothetical protein
MSDLERFDHRFAMVQVLVPIRYSWIIVVRGGNVLTKGVFVTGQGVKAGTDGVVVLSHDVVVKPPFVVGRSRMAKVEPTEFRVLPN